MKNLVRLLCFFAMIIIYQLATAQQSGNSTYGYNTGLGKADTADKLFLTDSSFIIPASVAMNVIADQYVVTFSSTEEAADVSECNTKMDKRINAFRGDLKKMGITDKDVFVDMTTQNKIYDYK